MTNNVIAEYAFAGTLVLVNTAIILTGHGNDPGALQLMGFLGILITFMTTHGIAQRTATTTAEEISTKVNGHEHN